MELDIIKKLIEQTSSGHSNFVRKADVAERYYKNKNDITKDKSPSNIGKVDISNNPLRNADNRIPFNWFGFLVNQKISYMFTYPPTFDIGDDKINSAITDVLGDRYPKEAKTLGKNASICSKAWLHTWIDDNNEFQYANIDPKQVKAIYSSDLNRKLLAVLREYKKLDEDAREFVVYEYWDNENCYVFKNNIGNSTSTGLVEFNKFTKKDLDTNLESETNVYKHNFGEVPFIEFPNNDLEISDLDNVKHLIDVYDKVYSGFVNDIEDIQEVIFVLTNYGGADLTEFLKGLKEYKTIDLQSTGADDKSGLSTITINIPIEARDSLLKTTEKQIYVQGQGVDPKPENFANTSGVALKFLYTLLELKAGLMETEFRLGFAKLVRMICRHLGYSPKRVLQVWSRNMIQNDLELADICSKSVGIVSEKTNLKNHPSVDNVEEEEKQIKKEKEEAQREYEYLIPNDGVIDET
ncbi:phage portal protein [Clostridioides sp. GD02377]|uniref:phage portal protein n=1 Tax=unclassified Clostridioides TaxID=2635829 RepID=UPI0038A51AE0